MLLRGQHLMLVFIKHHINTNGEVHTADSHLGAAPLESLHSVRGHPLALMLPVSGDYWVVFIQHGSLADTLCEVSWMACFLSDCTQQPRRHRIVLPCRGHR